MMGEGAPAAPLSETPGLPACPSCGAERGTPHLEGCTADVTDHYGEAEMTITIEED